MRVHIQKKSNNSGILPVKMRHTENADWNTAKHLALRAVINQLIAFCSGNWNLEAKAHGLGRG